jgi:GNAT superfamily N-acetyltransferase
VIFVALNEAAQKGKLLLVDGGMLRFHLRRDGVVTIHELIVLPSHRRRGIGRRLVQEVRDRYPGAVIRLTCPGEYEANRFWRAMGFGIAAYKPGGRLAVWEQYPSSSTAPTEIPSSPGSP